MIHIFEKQDSLVSQYISEVRDVEVQKDSMRFRKNMERLGQIFAYEISKTLQWKETIVTTSLGEAECKVIKEQPVIATNLRAGLPMHHGMLGFFDSAENAFVSAYR
ncbi:MAG: uracil phosphoribosyltransferase, partial [Bacteroidota bacterium]